MGNSHSEASQGKPPDKNSKAMDKNVNRSRVLCNTPYLTAMFKKLSEQSDTSSSKDSERVTQTVFEDAFNGPLKVLGRLLFGHIKAASVEKRRASIHLDEFLKVSTDVLSLLSNSQQLNYYFDVFCDGNEFMTVESVYHMVQVCYSVALSVAYLPFDHTEGSTKLLQALATSIMGPKQELRKQGFVDWCLKHLPHLFNGIHSFLMMKLSGAKFESNDWHKRMSQGNLSSTTVSFIASLEGHTCSLTHCVLWMMTSCLPNLYVLEQRGKTTPKGSIVPNFLMSRMQTLIEQKAWCLLYNSDQNGLSVNRFEHHVFSYKGPTVMIITFDHNVYALATDQEWKETSVSWGGENTVLYQLSPRFSQVDHGRIIFLNHHTRGMFKGIQLGSDIKSPVLKIEDMSTVTHYGVPLQLEAIEVWGCASTEIRDIQMRQKAWERKEVEKLHNRKLKLENWEDNPDRMLLNWVGINTSHHEKA